MIIPKIKSLIKDDFSDFTAFSGATVTRNKTFPIDVFKGGRNLLLNSDFSKGLQNWLIQRQNAVVEGGMLKTINNDGTNPSASIYQRRPLLDKSKEYVATINIKGVGRLSVNWGGNPDVWINFSNEDFKDIVIQIPNQPTTNQNFVISVDSVDYSYIKHIKLELDSTPTHYSPAPEDGYGLDLPNGAYHIQTSGGLGQQKLVVSFQQEALKDKYVKVKGEYHSFNNVMRISINGTNAPFITIPLNETYQIDDNYLVLNYMGLTYILRANNPTGSLDFIASDPMIITGDSIDSMNILDIMQESEINETKYLTLLSNGEDLTPNFIQYKMSTQGSLYARNMRMCEIELKGKYDLKGQWLNIKRGVSNDNIDNGNEQIINYGDFGVLKQEYDLTSDRTKLVCYDKMLLTQIPYDSEVMNLTYPLTISQVIHRLAIVCKLDLVVNTTANLYELVNVDVWANQSFTYSDVLSHIAQATGSMFSIKFGKLEMHNVEEIDFTIQSKFTSLMVSDKYDKINILNISQEPQHYNSYEPINALDIPVDERRELVFQNNPILLQDMNYWKTKIFPLVNDIEYQTFNAGTLGYGIFDVGDMVKLYQSKTDETYNVLITRENFVHKHQLIAEIDSAYPLTYQDQYVVETDQKRQGQKTFLIVDQLNGVIKALVQSYDDLNDKTAQLRIDVDSIELQVENIGNGNIQPNGSGELGYYGYVGGSNLVYTDDLVYQDYMTYSHGFIPKKMLGSLSEWGLSFISSGYDITPIAYVVPNTPYAYKAKVERFKPFSIQLLEFKNVEDSENLVIHKSTTHTFNNPMQYVSFTQDLDVETQFTRIRYDRTGVTYLDRLEITEVMFNRGVPSEWQQSATNAMIYSQTTRTQLSDRIDDVVDTVEVIDGQVFINKTNITQLGNEIELKVNVNGVISAINLTSEQAKILANHISLEGLTTINGNFKVLPNGDVEFTNAKGTNVNLSGKITTNDLTATGGTIGRMSINDGMLEYVTPLQDRKYSEADLSIVRQIVLGMISRNNYYNYIYDVNNDGNIDALDINLIKRDLSGIAPITNKKVQYRVRVGTTNGDVNTSVLYNNGQVGANFNMSGETITGNNANFVGMTLNNKLVIPDENGFLKVVEL